MNTASISYNEEQELGTICEELLACTDTLSPEAIYIQKEQLQPLLSAINNLSPKDKRLLELTSGICLDCFGKIKKHTYQQTALPLGMTESAIEKRRRKILESFKSIYNH